MGSMGIFFKDKINIHIHTEKTKGEGGN